MTVDELAAHVTLPVRTIREYQSIGLLPAPERRGRVGIYGTAHVTRLQLIARLQERGYSLAGIGDLLKSWRDGHELNEVLGLAPDELVHIDEPGAATTVDQLARLLPDLVPSKLDELLAVGLVDACGPDRYCVPSPSLLQLTVDALAAGYRPRDVLEFLRSLHEATSALANATAQLLGKRPAGLDDDELAQLATRGRGLLAHATGRMTIYELGRRLDTDTPARRNRTHR